MFYFQLLQPELTDGYQKGKYKPQIVALAEGLLLCQPPHEIGANINYYARTPHHDYLLSKTPFVAERVRCLIVSLDALLQPDQIINERMALCKRLKKPVFVFDWIASRFLSMTNQESLLNKLDSYLFYSYIPEMAKQQYAKVLPWPIGYTQRVSDMCQRYWKPFQERDKTILWSHRVPHHVRKTVWDSFYSPYLVGVTARFNDLFERPKNIEEFDVLMNYQTGNRHNPNFYRALCSSQLVDCCGGFFKGQDIRQWDSYMLWEGFQSGCCVITLDMEYYGFKTGAEQEPKNMVHYIGLRLDQPEYLKQLAQDILDRKIDFEAIAIAGRDWATRHFSPHSRAIAFLALEQSFYSWP